MALTVDQPRRHFLTARRPDACRPDSAGEWSPEADFTAHQFRPDKAVGGRIVVRPSDAPRRHRELYEIQRPRVFDALAVD
ncbi:hypothetical protein [Cellulomonas alba]|uniref:Uncharacterized protein n=1 Tax=Cellulomonas alba TaxID=3053467 RepID=A0ABT7SFU9_9CELL|nr:hypothetical protein [Cellulomonas alba]MDM7855001.1 hypothetical protein [Cellulomonas alba]